MVAGLYIGDVFVVGAAIHTASIFEHASESKLRQGHSRTSLQVQLPPPAQKRPESSPTGRAEIRARHAGKPTRYGGEIESEEPLLSSKYRSKPSRLPIRIATYNEVRGSG
jgi:hypothetical protein